MRPSTHSSYCGYLEETTHLLPTSMHSTSPYRHPSSSSSLLKNCTDVHVEIVSETNVHMHPHLINCSRYKPLPCIHHTHTHHPPTSPNVYATSTITLTSTHTCAHTHKHARTHTRTHTHTHQPWTPAETRPSSCPKSTGQASCHRTSALLAAPHGGT